MDLATALSIVQTILTAIQTLHQLTHLFSFSHHKKELERLLKTVKAIRSVLADADAKRGALSCQEKHYIEELKDAVYNASDVLDEFVTLVKRKTLNEASHKLSGKVKSSVSCFTLYTNNLSDKIKDVNVKLEAIVSDSRKFMFKVDYKPIKFIKPESSSFVCQSDPIIGREEDLEKFVGMLFDPDDVNVSSLAIVGMGGLGKTAFAQLVYNDPRVTTAFQLKCWTCIADQDQWNLDHILAKISKELGVDKDKVSKELGGKKYLLVLDDVWTETYHKWLELEKYLMVGGSGSRIVITTRSKKTARMIEGVRVHDLQGLSKEMSWCLFERMAFRLEQRKNPDDEELVKLGKEIVKKCMNVPLAIRVVGSFLRGESKPTWLSFIDKDLANISESDDTMINLLSLSYHQLPSSLKSCFAYCAIFPKDFEIDKQILIYLWMAQGYINVECEGEEYFRILLQRCFFQDVTEDKWGEIISFKIHDLLHDIAEQASGKEIYKLNSDSDVINVDKKVRHLTLLNGFCPQGTFKKTYIRTCLQVKAGTLSLNSLKALLAGNNSITNWTCLRSLYLRGLEGDSLPKSIGKVFHLRYLDLAWSDKLEVLPKSITKLVNLQTLILRRCSRLKELPNDIYKLVDLTTLDLTDCNRLSHMHSNLGMLTKLHTLGDVFVVDMDSSNEKRCFNGLEVLPSLNNLKGSLHIKIMVHRNANYKKEDYGDGAYLISKEHLSKIVITFWRVADTENREWEQSLLEEMQPHVNIKHLVLHGYNGETMPRWPGREDNSTLFYFPNFIELEISNCPWLRLLPSLENLPHLKTLKLKELWNVEYLVNINLDVLSLSEGSSFFPCLEQLRIRELPKLKGWWQGFGEQNEPFPCFAKLKDLTMTGCKMLKFIPISSSLMKSMFVSNSQQYVERNNTDLLLRKYMSVLPSDSKSRFITITDFERLTEAMGPYPASAPAFDIPDPNPTE